MFTVGFSIWGFGNSVQSTHLKHSTLGCTFATGKLLLRVLAESEFSRFEDRQLSSASTLHLMSEPALLNNFIRELRALSEGGVEQAELKAIGWN
jgi:hypothetical protein